MKMKCIQRNRIRLALAILLFVSANALKADEGMWLPYLLDRLQLEEMQSRGFSLSAEDIYSLNQDCLTDAVVIFGSGCTGSIVSEKGLVLTNHHCGYDEILSLSSLENDYLTNGFWASSVGEELPVPGLSVKFLRQAVDVTDLILTDIESSSTIKERKLKIAIAKDSLRTQVSDTTDYVISIKPFYYENTWLLFLYEEFTDVRLVGNPPESLGKFGGDTDNWMWPRHNSDFSLYRVYSDANGKPADYHEDNIPRTSSKFMSISQEGIDEGDFTMVLGYPGRTYEYFNSDHLTMLSANMIEPRVEVLEGELDIIGDAMQADELARLKYAGKDASISNVWKKYRGMLAGFERLDVGERKKDYEHQISEMIGAEGNQKVFESLQSGFAKLSSKQSEYVRARRLFYDAVLGIESIDLLVSARDITLDSALDEQSKIAELSELADVFFKNYDKNLDKELANYFLEVYSSQLGIKFQPKLLLELSQKKNFCLNNYIDRIYKKSFLADEDLFREKIRGLAEKGVEAVKSDAIVKLYADFYDVYSYQIFGPYNFFEEQLDSLYSIYLPLIKEVDTLRNFYPDANFTMRLSLGNVAGYSPSDAINLCHQTYAEGILEKHSLGTKDYYLMPEVVDKLSRSDSSRYADSIGLPTCFSASNHTSGGSSGSPVLNKNGELIGINFDRSWESTVGDYYFDEEINRNIIVDIRFILFVMDEIAGMEYLVNEMMGIEGDSSKED